MSSVDTAYGSGSGYGYGYGDGTGDRSEERRGGTESR